MADTMTLIHPDHGTEHEFPTMQAFKMVNTKTQGKNWTFKIAKKENGDAGSPENNKRAKKQGQTDKSKESPKQVKIPRQDEPK